MVYFLQLAILILLKSVCFEYKGGLYKYPPCVSK